MLRSPPTSASSAPRISGWCRDRGIRSLFAKATAVRFAGIAGGRYSCRAKRRARRHGFELFRAQVERFRNPPTRRDHDHSQRSRARQALLSRPVAIRRGGGKSPRGRIAEIERLRAEPDLARDLRAKGARRAGRFFMENKRPGLFGPHHVACPGRRAGTKRRDRAFHAIRESFT